MASKRSKLQAVVEPHARFAARPLPPSFAFRPVRTRLLSRLVEATVERPKLISIPAPVGYGKTVLMSEMFKHLGQSGERCHWAGLDERHSNLERVKASFRLPRAEVESGVYPTQALLEGDAPIDQRIDLIIWLLAGLPQPATIFIDNLNSCIDEDLGGLLDAFIFRTPLSVRFVWSSTIDHGFDLGRAELQGLMRQVAHSDLCLEAAEISELIGTELSALIGAGGLETILRQTEGWPAAIRMAQIILAESEKPLAVLESFSGTDEDITALLKRRVLAGFSLELRDFLLCLAQLRSFTLDLLRHAIDEISAERHLQFLLQRNVFVIPLDRNRRRYRLHGLFRDYLLAEANAHLPARRRREVLRRATE